MDMVTIEIITVVVMIALMLVGTPVPVALGLTGIVGLFAYRGAGTLVIAAIVMFNTMNNFLLLAIPLFILMGVVLAKGGAGEKLYNLFDAFYGKYQVALELPPFAPALF